MRHMTYDITKHSPEKQVLQKYNFLFVWNANKIFCHFLQFIFNLNFFNKILKRRVNFSL